MAKPWERYAAQKQEPVDLSKVDLTGNAKPWEKYGGAEPAPEEKGLLQRAGESALGGIVAAGEFVDKYTGAPTRKVIGELQEGKGLGESLSAGVSQFGADPRLAPTGQKIMQKAGVPDTKLSEIIPSIYSDTGEGIKLQRGGLLDPSASGAAGLAVDIVADPTNILPLGTIAKGVGTAAKGTTKGLLKGAALGAKGAALGADVVTGTKVGTRAIEGARAVGEAVGELGQSFKGLVRTSVSPKFQKNAAIATKHGIDPNLLPAQTKYEGLLPRLEQAQAMGVAGDEIIEQNAKAFSQYDDAVDNVIQKIGGAYDPVAAGEVIKDGYQKAVANLFEQNALRYSNLSKLSPNLRASPKAIEGLNKTLNGIEKKMKGYSVRGIAEQKAMAKDVLSQIEAIRASKGNVKQLSEQIGEIGRIAYSPKSSWKLPIDQDAFRDIYKGLKDTMEKTADDLSLDLGKQLRESNKNISEFLQNLEPIQKALDNKSVAPESLFRQLTADSKRLESLFNMVGPEEARALKGALMSSIVKTGMSDNVQIGKTINALKAAKPKLSKVFSPSELGELEELLELGKDMGPRLQASVPQTGVTGLFKDLKQRIPEAMIDKQVLKALKSGNKAEIDRILGAVPRAAEAVQETAPMFKVPVPTRDDLVNSILKQRRSRPGLLLKGTQSVAPSTYGGENE